MRACPFCGGTSPFTDAKQFMTERDGFHFVVVCGVCKARGSQRQDHHGAVTAWNVRAEDKTRSEPLNDLFETILGKKP
jgi:Lar family restriction alleviation protein